MEIQSIVIVEQTPSFSVFRSAFLFAAEKVADHI